jgi:hypothetical protein
LSCEIWVPHAWPVYIYNIVSLVIKSGRQLTICVKFEVTVNKWAKEQRFYKDSPKTVKLQKLKHLISHSGIFMMYLRLITKLLIGWISFTYNKELEIKEIVSADSFAHLFTVTSNLTQMVNCLPDFMTKETKL